MDPLQCVTMNALHPAKFLPFYASQLIFLPAFGGVAVGFVFRVQRVCVQAILAASMAGQRPPHPVDKRLQLACHEGLGEPTCAPYRTVSSPLHLCLWASLKIVFNFLSLIFLSPELLHRFDPCHHLFDDEDLNLCVTKNGNVLTAQGSGCILRTWLESCRDGWPSSFLALNWLRTLEFWKHGIVFLNYTEFSVLFSSMEGLLLIKVAGVWWVVCSCDADAHVATFWGCGI